MQNPTTWLIALAAVMIAAIVGFYITRDAPAPEQPKVTVQPKR